MTRSHRLPRRLAFLALVSSLLPLAPAVAGETLAFDLSAEQLCAHASVASAGDLTLSYRSPWCVAATAGGLIEAQIGFHEALQLEIPQPPEFYGYFRESQGEASVIFHGPPPAGVQVTAATLLQHLVVVWLFDQDGVAIVPIGDPIAFYNPAPPPYLAGAIVGKARYGEPVEITVRQTTDTHMLVVRQGATTLAATTLKKIFAHPDAMSYAALLEVDGDLPATPLLSFGDASFRGVKSPAEIIIGSTPAPALSIGAIERLGAEVRVYP